MIVIGFVQTTYTVNENVGVNNFQICTAILNGVSLSQSIMLQITLLQGNGNAVRKFNCQKSSMSKILVTMKKLCVV